MRNAYALLGLAWLIIIVAGTYAFNRNFTRTGDTAPQNITRSEISTSMATSTLTLRSPAFADNGSMPSRFTCDGDRTVNPELTIGGVPPGTKSLALIMDDPDVPKALHPDGVFEHWILFNIPPSTTAIPENGSVSTVGANGVGANAYTQPCTTPHY